ncbi:MAG: signal recognition particle-docking protein FtsY [Microscillaceae bacterium]|nr:signal recognition particle-docking protein FtsY [Microscillaceae bacterium]
MGVFDFFSKGKNKENLDKGLEKTKNTFFSNLKKAVIGKDRVDEQVLDNLEEILIGSDVGVETTLKIIQRIEERVRKDKYLNTQELDHILRDEIVSLLAENNLNEAEHFEVPQIPGSPYVLLVVGVNGTGKTTTIGKLSHQFSQLGNKVVLGAADTFRAAAVDQLKVWGQRSQVNVIDLGMKSDPAAVAYEAVKQGMDVQADVIIIDTAGRLQTKKPLMDELSKIKRVIKKILPDAPHDVMLVLDGSTGQNAFNQAAEFTKATEVTCLAITKLDGTAKGGVVIGISDQFKIPIKYIGVGEKIEDLQIFNKKEFVDSLFKRDI